MDVATSTWTIGQFITGAFVAAMGFVIVWKADWFLQNFGSVPFAEKHMHSEGGSRLLYKLIGMLIMFFGLMHATGLLAPFMTWVVKITFGNYIEKKDQF